MYASKIRLPGGREATEAECLAALSQEASRRKTSYGELVASTTELDRNAIIRSFCMRKGQN